MIAAIAGRELKSLFLSPLAWSILAVVMFILGWIFLVQVDSFSVLQSRLASVPNGPGVTDWVVAPMLGDAGVILMLVSPLITMRLLSEERRARTLGLLFSSPVSMTEIVLGKYLGALVFFMIMLALIAIMPLSLLAGTSLDLGMLAAGLLALALLLATFAAAGLFMSSLTEQPTVAAVSTFGMLLLLWIIDWAGTGRPQVGGAFSYLSLAHHYQALLKGLVSSTDIVYFLLVIVTFLVLSIRRLDRDRLPH
ncbi:MAG: ABC transporter permease subunit [Gammaproteobacteria bacterium]|jgi:ABC-2 type transport system permease protein